MPAFQETGGVSRGARTPGKPVDRARELPERSCPAPPRREPRRRDSLPLETGNVDHGERPASHCRDGALAAGRLDERGVGFHDACVGGETAHCPAHLRGHARRDHVLGLDRGFEPFAQLPDAGRALPRARRYHVDVARPVATQLGPHVIGDAARVRVAEKIAPVEDDDLAPNARRELSQVAAVHDIVHVFLRVHDPRDRVDARKQGVHPLSVVEGDRVEVGEVEHGDVGERATGVLAHLLDAQPLQQARELSSTAGGNPRDRVRRRWPASAGQAHFFAGDRIQQRRLSDAGAADKREDVGAAGKAEPRARSLADPDRGACVEAE